MTKDGLAMNRHGIHRAIAWAKLRIWLVLSNIFIIIGGVSWAWYQYNSILSTEIMLLIGVIIFVILSICVIQIGGNSTQVKILHQKDLEHCIRMDIVDAVESTLGMVLKKYVPGYKNTLTNLSVGEELMKEARLVSSRYARFQNSLQEHTPDMQLAEAIDAFVAQSCKKHEISRDIIQIDEFLQHRTVAE